MAGSMINRAKRVWLGVCVAVGSVTASMADPITFDFTYVGINNNAMGVGHVTFEDSLLPNPGFFNPTLPDAAVLDLQLTVTGATSGNGTYQLADFTGLVWDTNGSMLDFSMDLVGQPTAVDPWGTPSGDGGDFNLFSGGGGPDLDYQDQATAGQRQIAPSGVDFFTLATEGGTGDEMVLTSMWARQRVPTMSPWGLIVFVVLLAGAAILMRKRSLS